MIDIYCGGRIAPLLVTGLADLSSPAQNLFSEPVRMCCYQQSNKEEGGMAEYEQLRADSKSEISY
jgi:hypothetical protein